MKVSIGKRLLWLAIWAAVFGWLVRAEAARGEEAVHAKYTVVILMDGVSAENFYYELDAGNLPNIEHYIVSRGVRVDNALCCVPSCTFDSISTMLTGTYPSRHGIPATKWFDPTLRIIRQYNSADGSFRAQQDLRSPLVFDLVSPSASISTDFTKNATYASTLRAWRGIAFFLHRWQMVDRFAIEEIAKLLKKKNPPRFTYVHLIGSDATGHAFGPFSFRYIDDFYHYDKELGKTFRRLEKAGIFKDTLFFIIADHGMEYINPDEAVTPDELAKFLGVKLERPPVSAEEEPEKKKAAIPGDCVMIPNGDRVLFIYFRAGDNFPSVINDNTLIGAREQFTARDLLEKLLEHPSVENVCCRVSSDTIRVLCQGGEGEIHWSRDGARSVYWAKTLKGKVNLWASLGDQWAAAGHSREEWLRKSCQSMFPDAVVQLAEFFACKDAPAVAAFARRGANFVRRNKGGHGGLHRIDMNVPMLVAGPGVGHGRVLTARLVDVVPTALDLMGVKTHAAFDGVSRAEDFRHPMATELLAK